MIKAKCIKKVRNKNNIIIGYTLQDNTGYIVTVDPKQLKEKIASGAVDIVNLRLTPSGRLIDKRIEDTIKGYTIMDNDEEANVNQYNKTLMLGVAPDLDANNNIVGVSGKHVIFTDMTNKFARNIIEPNVKAEFNGSKELEKTMKYISIRLEFKEVIVNNPCVMANLGEGKDYSISIVSPSIKINHKFISIKTVDEVFKILKNQFSAGISGGLFTIVINTSNLDNEEVFDRTLKILKRQKPSSKVGRRCYDIMIYFEFIYSMWLSTGACDDRYKQLVLNYLGELRDNERVLEYYERNDTHAIATLEMMNKYLGSILVNMRIE